MRRGRVLTLLSTVLILILAGSAASAAGNTARTPRARAAGSIGFTDLRSTVLHVKGGGRKLHMMVSAIKASHGHPGATVTLSTGQEFLPGETHSWTFELKPSAFAYSSTSGRGHLVTGKSLKHYGAIKLNFRRKSQSKSKCLNSAGTATTVVGRLTGTVYFNTGTGSHGWGAVGSHKHKISFKGKNSITLLSSGCPIGGGGSTACVSGLTWSGPFSSASQASVFGNVTKTGHRTSSTIEVERSVTLSKPSGASRQDVLIAKEPTPAFHSGSGSLDITTSGSAIKGSATIANTSAAQNNYQCTHGGKKKLEKAKSYSGTWSTSGFTADFKATGKATLPSSGSGFFTTETY